MQNVDPRQIANETESDYIAWNKMEKIYDKKEPAKLEHNI